jgi:ankyrin repeat protein
MLLAAGADTSAADGDGLTALHYAAKRGDLETARCLVERGADVDAAASAAATPPLTPVGLACVLGHGHVVSFLLEHGADLKDESGAAALRGAILNRDAEMVSILLSHGVSPNAASPDSPRRPIHWAIGQPTIIKLLLARGADPNATRERDWVPLQDAAAVGDVESVEALVDSGANVDGRSSAGLQGLTCPLQVAVGNGKLDAAKALHRRGADLGQKTQGGMTALLIAAADGYLEAAAWLIEEGASMRGVCESTQETAFDVAVTKDAPEMVELLVRRGCFRAARDDDGEGDERGSSAPAGEHADDGLVMLAYRGDLDGVKKVMISGRTLSRQVSGEALHVAAARGHLGVVDLLLRFGAKGDLQDINGRTALHYAARHLHNDVADLLVEHGASTEIEDMNGSTPIDLAVVHGDDAAGFIQKHMDNLSLALNRRPSLLTVVTPNHAANLTVMGVRRAIRGSWEGHYAYLAWSEGDRDAFVLDIPSEASGGSRPSTFSMVGEDVVGRFHFHGFVDAIGTVWFVKLYQHHGWLYRGQLDAEKGVLRGTWGSNRKLWFGTFELRRKG